MNTQAHIDETTGEQLASVYRNHSGECQVRLIPWVLELLRACARKDDTPPGHHAPRVLRPSLPRRREHGDVEPRALRLRGAMRRGARELAPTHCGRHAVPRRAVDAPHPGGGDDRPPRHQRFPGARR